MRLPAPRSIVLIIYRGRVPWALLAWAMGRGLVVRFGEVLAHAEILLLRARPIPSAGSH